MSRTPPSKPKPQAQAAKDPTMTTNHATRFQNFFTPAGRTTLLAVNFTDQDGQTHEVLGPVLGAHLKTSTKPRPNGNLHDATTTQGWAACAAAGVKFWAVADDPRTYWATKDGQFFLVRHITRYSLISATPVDAWGTPTGETTEVPA